MQKSLKLCLSVQIFIGETVKIVKNECADLAEIFKSPYFIVLYCWVFIASKEGEKEIPGTQSSFCERLHTFCSFIRCFFERVAKLFLATANLKNKQKNDPKILCLVIAMH